MLGKLVGLLAIVYGFSLLGPNMVPSLLAGASIFGGLCLIALPNRRYK